MELQMLTDSDSAWDAVAVSQVKKVQSLLTRIEFTARHLRAHRLGDETAAE